MPKIKVVLEKGPALDMSELPMFLQECRNKKAMIITLKRETLKRRRRWLEQLE